MTFYVSICVYYKSRPYVPVIGNIIIESILNNSMPTIGEIRGLEDYVKSLDADVMHVTVLNIIPLADED